MRTRRHARRCLFSSRSLVGKMLQFQIFEKKDFFSKHSMVDDATGVPVSERSHSAYSQRCTIDEKTDRMTWSIKYKEYWCVSHSVLEEVGSAAPSRELQLEFSSARRCVQRHRIILITTRISKRRRIIFPNESHNANLCDFFR